jgi:hypothetical protein
MTRRSLLVLFLLAFAALAHAQLQPTIRFDQCKDQATPGHPVQCVIGDASFSGAWATINTDPFTPSQGVMYWTVNEDYCIQRGCKSTIDMQFATEVSDVKFSVANGWPLSAATYKAHSDNGADTFVITGPYIEACCNNNHWRQMVMPGNNLRHVTVESPLFTGCIRTGCKSNYWNYSIDDVIYTKTPSDTRIVFGTRDIPGMGDPLVKNLPRSTQLTANYPIGAVFFARLERKQGQNWVPIQASSELASETVTDRNTLETTALFPSHPVIAFNRFARENEKVFQGIHYGTVLVTLVTSDSKFPRVQMKVTINPAARLGVGQYVDSAGATQNVNFSFDATILQRAHRTGIPPQWIKAQIEQEANFNGTAYRWEARTRDWEMVEDPASPYFHGTDTADFPLRRYRMGDGTELCNPTHVPGVPSNNCSFNDLDDISPRGRYRIIDATSHLPRNIVAADGVVTLRQIVNADNDRFGWFPASPTPVVPKPGGRRRAVAHPDPFNIPAQTTLASSYGLLQLVYTDIIDRPLHWRGISGRYNPTLLFDTAPNHNRGGGSLVLGTRLATLKWGRTNPNPVDPSYDSPASFVTDLRDMYIEYNGRSGYGGEVEGRIGHYAPIPSTVITSPLCTTQSFSQQTGHASLTAGGSAFLGVAIDADDVEYQWFSGTQTNAVSGATSQTLVVSAPGTYWCRAKTECGFLFSDPIVVSLEPACTPAAIRTQPETTKSVLQGMTTSFGIEATGTNVRYQWYEGDPTSPAHAVSVFDPPAAVPLVGETGPTVTVQPAETTTYFVYVSNSCGGAVSDIVHVTVQPCEPATIGAQSTPVTITHGDSTTLSVTPAGTGPFDIQWYTGTPGAATAIEGATGASYLATPASTTSYFATVSNRCGTVNSAPVLISVNEPCAPASISAQSASTSIVRGDSTTLSITPGGSTPRTIQWYAHGATIDGANDLTYLASPDATTTYTAKVTNDCGEATSTPIIVTVNDACAPASITAQSGSATITEGDSTLLSITPGGSSPRTIQWYAGSVAIDGANGATYEASPTTTVTYHATVTNDCGQATSTPVTITVVPACVAPSISAQSGSTSIINGDSTILSITPAGSTPRSIQWYTGTPGAGSSLIIAGAYASTLEVSPIAMTTYFAIVTNACGTATSTPVTITVTTACVQPSVTSQSTSTSIVRGDSTTLSVTTAGTSPRTVQWYYGTPANLSIIDGATGNSLPVSPTVMTTYTALVTNACGAAYSTPITITVTDACVPATITAQTSGASISNGDSATLSVSTSGSTPRAIQWYRGTPASPTLLSGETGSAIIVSPSITTSYFARVSNACGTDDSAPITVNVDCVRPGIFAQPNGDTIEQGQSVTLSVGATDTTSYQWYSNAQSFFAPINGETSPSLHDAPQSTRQYFVRLTNSCGSTDSRTVTVTVNPPTCNPIFITQQPANKSISEGQSATVTVGATGTSPQYQWQQNLNGVWTNLVGKTAASLTVTPSAGTYQYRVTVFNACTSITSAPVTVTVGIPCTPPAITQQPVDPNFTVIGQSAFLVVGASGSDLQYQWYRDGVALEFGTLNQLQVFAGSETHSFYCIVSNACGSVKSSTIVIESLCVSPFITFVKGDETLAPGESTVLMVQGGGTGQLHYQWYEKPAGSSSFTPLFGGATTNVTVVPPVTTQYLARVTNECGSIDSSIVTITVQ